MKQKFLKGCLFLMAVLSFAYVEAQTVSGTVTDGQMPLPGVNILVQGTSNGTTTDFDGVYTLNNVPADAVLVFSFLGYATQEIPVNGRETINVTLGEDASALSEVVVIGYGSVQRRDATGAVATVTSENFNRGVVASPEELIQGRTAGLQVTTTSGEPGAGVNIRIRGTTSVRGGNDPLFVVDGVPLAGDNVSAGGSNVGFGDSSPKNPLNFLNPQDIESMSVLKDASATAIYGSRGANGVVIITTKSGRGMTGGRFDYTTNLGVATPANSYDLLNREEFLNAYEGIGGEREAADFGGDTDWQDEITRTAFTQEHNLSYANSYNQGNYRVSLGYSDLMGIVENSSMERLSGRLNINHRLFNDKLKLGLQTAVSRVNDERAPISNNAGFQGDLLGGAYRANPTLQSDPDSEFTGQLNPNSLLKYTLDETETNRMLLNFSADYELVDGLSARLNLGYDKAESYRGFGISGDIQGVQSAVPGNGRSQINEIDNTNKLMEFTLNYEKLFENSKIDALVGYSYQEFDRQGINVSGWGFQNMAMAAMINDLQSSRDLLEGSIQGSYQQYGFDNSGMFVNRLFPDVVTERPTAPSGLGARAVAGDTFHTIDELQSFFGRVNYTLADKYLFTATLRADGSTRFGGNNQYGYFPSGAFAWQLGDEDFIPETFSTLKFRVGYGVTGNQEIPYNLYTPRDRFGGFGINDNGEINIPGTGQVTFRNEDLKWETTSQTNIGFDYGFFEDRLTGSIDYYYKSTTDLLFQTFSAQPAAQDFVWENLDANVINKGIEFSIDYNVFQEQEFFWNVGFNIAYNENMVEDFDGLVQTGGINGQGLTNAYAQLLAGGQPLFSYYLREFGGFDENGQTIYPNGDVQTFVGKSALPTTNLGFSTRMEYRNWDLSAFLTGQMGFYVYNNTENAFFTAGALNSGSNVTRNVIGNGEAANNAPDVSTRFLEKGDFLRLQNATLGYNFEIGPDSFLNALRLSVTGQNLFLITGYSGLDPEVNTDKSLNGIPTAGIEYTSYPRATTVTLGLKVSF